MTTYDPCKLLGDLFDNVSILEIVKCGLTCLKCVLVEFVEGLGGSKKKSFEPQKLRQIDFFSNK